MSRYCKLLILGWLVAGQAAWAFDSYREKSFVLDSTCPKDVRVVVEEQWDNGGLHTFDLWVPANGGAGFNLDNGDLHDPNNKRLGKCKIIRMKLDNIDGNRWFKAVDMLDMFGNRPSKLIDSPRHFLIENYEIKTFPCSRGKGL